MEIKTGVLTIKKVHEGKVLATLAEMGVADHDNDVLVKGLTGGRQLVAIKPQHQWDHVNLGVGAIYERNNTVEADLEYNLDIPSAKDWFEATRFSYERNHRFQYSFGYRVLDSERGQYQGKAVRFIKRIEVVEVSPVLLGASVGSQTLSVKEQENRGMAEPEVPVVESAPETAQEPLGDESLPSVEDYKNYPEDRRPPLPVLTAWLRLYRYHIPFLRDIRKKDGKDISADTIAEFSEVIQEAVEVASLLNIKVMTSHLMPNVEEEARRREWYDSRLHELSAEVHAEAQQQLQTLQGEAAALAEKARLRSARMKEMFGS